MHDRVQYKQVRGVAVQRRVEAVPHRAGRHDDESDTRPFRGHQDLKRWRRTHHLSTYARPRHRQIDRETRLVVASVAPSLLPEDREQVEQMGERVHLVLRGQLSAAYGDRAGETRSL